MNLQDSLTRAQKLSRENNTDMVVGQDETGAWTILPIDDSASDLLQPSVMVNESGIKYPDDHELVSRLIAKQ